MSIPVVPGTKFHHWTVIKEVKNNGRKRVLCQCDCGNLRELLLSPLKAGRSKSCSCLAYEMGSTNLKKNVVGKRFGRWKVLREAGRSKGGAVLWLCRCDCGNEKVIRGSAFQKGETKSCGCYNREMSAEKNTIDLTGKRFGRLIVISKADRNISNKLLWLCLCDCGNEKKILGHSLQKGNTKSCGCISASKFKDANDRLRSPMRADSKLFPQIPKCDKPRIVDGVAVVDCKMCGKSFIPTYKQIRIRIDAYRGKAHGESNFYCSDTCRRVCPIFGHKSNSPDPRIAPPKSEKQRARSCQTKSLKQIQCDEKKYNYCERCGDIIDVELHHTILVSENPSEAVNAASHILLCFGCHTTIHAGCK